MLIVRVLPSRSQLEPNNWLSIVSFQTYHPQSRPSLSQKLLLSRTEESYHSLSAFETARGLSAPLLLLCQCLIQTDSFAFLFQLARILFELMGTCECPESAHYTLRGAGQVDFHFLTFIEQCLPSLGEGVTLASGLGQSSLDLKRQKIRREICYSHLYFIIEFEASTHSVHGPCY